MKQQPNGEKGALLNDGRWNIFYVPNTAGVLRAVLCNWRGDGWLVHANSIEDPRRWLDGDRVFSRNS